MLVTFSCKNHANVTMFGEIAQEMIKMMGHSGTVPGAILAPNVPEALAQLKSALEQENRLDLNSAEPDDEDDSSEYTVSMINRAYPLLELLNTAIEGKHNVMWE
ncbi:DUF1840 domain-containing protein [Vibrio sp. Y2-5]|uniref:DUF1840 domain-containing protein n=1 Tax=Vibrio sp. Y2-5 TaxID=2743977 RepID=UPI0016607D8F|nr:DUF1840 domain-containing protein [Vibrio sp. Y2-5]MBD0786305.1 DUF1840 domain-containing protein [Vibrio sp. Y2-5]